MPKYAIVCRYVDDSDSWLWSGDDWKFEICSDFDDSVVIFGNSYYHDHIMASWWDAALDIISIIENRCDTFEELLEYHGDEYAEDKLREIWDMYYNRHDTDTTDFIVDVVRVLYPNLHIDWGTIRGYGSSEWREAVVLSDVVSLELVEDWYFGNVYRIDLYDLSDLEDAGEDISDLDSIDWDNYSSDEGGYMAESELRSSDDVLYDYFGVSAEDAEIINLG